MRRARDVDGEEVKAKLKSSQQYVVFGDLHAGPKTIARACTTLRRVGEYAKSRKAIIVSLGDFWDQRGVLHVRNLDPVIAELDIWSQLGLQAIFIPGNHDQVTLDGLVHAVKLFDAYPNIRVATTPIVDTTTMTAFIPWREQDQAVNFRDAVSKRKWTIFAHAEIEGAIANSGKRADGKVPLALLEEHARACYLGHYHKRQKLGSHTWYIGSPFEQNIGERDDPHGIAVVSLDRVEPEWIDLNEFPKHYRISIENLDAELSKVRSIDVVELTAPPETLGTQAMADAIAKLPTQDVRPVAARDLSPKIAAVAMTIEEAISAYVEQEKAPESYIDEGKKLLKLGHTTTSVVPLAPIVYLRGVTAKNFCAIRGTLKHTFDEGMSLLRGPIGIGKTSLLDAVTWCLYGTTTPRKAGSHTSSLKGDEVIHDGAKEVAVSVVLALGSVKNPDNEYAEVTITRSKREGSGAKIQIDGLPSLPSGITDQQTLINTIVGIDLQLWRACVYLGQGAVGNFITDADKNRKALLSNVFGLSVCDEVLKSVRDQAKLAGLRLDQTRIDLISNQKVQAVLTATDYSAQIVDFEAKRAATVAALEGELKQHEQTISQADVHLAAEAQWLESKRLHEEHLDRLTKQLSALASGSAGVADLQRQFGAAQAERALVERDLNRLKGELAKAIEAATAGVLPCPACGRPMEGLTEDHLRECESKVAQKEYEVHTFDARLSNITEQLRARMTSSTTEQSSVEQQIGDARTALGKVAEGLNALARLKQNRDDHARQLEKTKVDLKKQAEQVNPYKAQADDQERRLIELRSKEAECAAKITTIEAEQKLLAFWADGFSAKGIPTVVLRTALLELETYANKFLARMLNGAVHVKLMMDDDDLRVLYFHYDKVLGTTRERRYEQLSGGQRRCVEIAFNPFALSEMIFSRAGVKVSFLAVDELTTHLGQEEKPLVCSLLRELDRKSIVVIDHDMAMQSEFDRIYDVSREPTGETSIVRAS